MESFTSEEATAAAGDGEDADSDVDLDDFGMSGWGQFAPDEPVQQQPPTKGRGRKAANTAKVRQPGMHPLVSGGSCASFWVITSTQALARLGVQPPVLLSSRGMPCKRHLRASSPCSCTAGMLPGFHGEQMCSAVHV